MFLQGSEERLAKDLQGEAPLKSDSVIFSFAFQYVVMVLMYQVIFKMQSLWLECAWFTSLKVKG